MKNHIATTDCAVVIRGDRGESFPGVDFSDERDHAIFETQRRLFFAALHQLSVDGRLQDPDMQWRLDDALFAGHDGGLDPVEVMKLVGNVHRVPSLDLPGRQRALAEVGRYVARLVETHLGPLIDAEAERQVDA